MNSAGPSISASVSGDTNIEMNDSHMDALDATIEVIETSKAPAPVGPGPYS